MHLSIILPVQDSLLSTGNIQIVPLGDSALLVNFGNIIDASVNERVLFLHYQLVQSSFEGFVESVPSYASLAVFYDVQKIRSQTLLSAFAFVKNFMQQLLRLNTDTFYTAAKMMQIPVCYDLEFGPDLEEMAGNYRLGIDEIIRLHASVIYRVYMIGFLPGFAYMGTVPDQLILPRKEQPRIKVPEGSVGIAGAKTGIYPFESPGGWQLIGRTPLKIFDRDNREPCLLAPGDQVQFVPIARNKFEQLSVH